jgi:hypothetical protein
MSQLINSYLFDKPVHLNSFFYREDNRIEQFWTQASVPGPTLCDIPIYILTSSSTISAAEGFSYTLQQYGRAKVVGEVTAGGAHPQRPYHSEDEGITMHIPYGRAINPVSQTNWEGTGVVPDIDVPAHEALEVAIIDIFKARLENETEEAAIHAIKMQIEDAEARRSPVQLDHQTLLEYTGKYARGLEVGLDQGSLVLSIYRLIPMGHDKFMTDRGQEHILFTRDENGKISKLEVVMRNGQRIPFARQDN